MFITYENYKDGITINGTSCYVDVISDSQGYSNKFDACGIVVKGSNNVIRGSIIDGRLEGALSCGLYVNKNAFLNDINLKLIFNYLLANFEVVHQFIVSDENFIVMLVVG